MWLFKMLLTTHTNHAYSPIFQNLILKVNQNTFYGCSRQKSSSGLWSLWRRSLHMVQHVRTRGYSLKKGMMTWWEFKGVQIGRREFCVVMTTSCAVRTLANKITQKGKAFSTFQPNNQDQQTFRNKQHCKKYNFKPPETRTRGTQHAKHTRLHTETHTLRQRPDTLPLRRHRKDWRGRLEAIMWDCET